MRKSRGFLLIELLLAVAVTGIVVATCLDIFDTANRASRQAQTVSEALNLCEQRMEEIRNLPVLQVGTGTNPADLFLPNLSNVSVTQYFPGYYLTESDYYAANYGTSPLFQAFAPPRRTERITQIEWVDDPAGGTAQDYFKVTVTVYYQDGGERRSASLVTYVSVR